MALDNIPKIQFKVKISEKKGTFIDNGKNFIQYLNNKQAYNHFLMFYQVFLSPKVKQYAIITYKHGI